MTGSSGDCLEADLAENQLTEIEEARAFAQAFIDTVREPVLVLDQDLRVITGAALSIGHSRLDPKIPKAGCFTNWAMVPGTFRSFACSWKRSYPSTA
jgi:hypothetical protein